MDPELDTVGSNPGRAQWGGRGQVTYLLCASVSLVVPEEGGRGAGGRGMRAVPAWGLWQ